MTSKYMILTAIAIGALSVAANAQMSNSMGTMSKPAMKPSTSHPGLPPKSEVRTDMTMDKKSDAMEDKKEMHSRHHHLGRHHHHHHRMMHNKM